MSKRRHKLSTSLSTRLLVWAIVWIKACLPVGAQNNPYKIHDSLYPLYLKAHKARNEQACLPLADELYRKARGIGDRKAQVLALIVPMLHYQYKHDEPNFERTLKLMQEEALKYDYEQYYYFGMTSKVNLLCNMHRYYDAYMYLQQMEDFARKHNHPYGMYSGLIALGNLHYGRSELTLAISSNV